MSGERRLSNLIKGMKPQLQAGEYVFCTVADNQIPKDVQPIGIFREAEGTTLIISKQEADRLSIPYSFVAAWITLTIHSSLEAVGLTADLLGYTFIYYLIPIIERINSKTSNQIFGSYRTI